MALTKISGSILKDPLNLGEVSIGGTLTYQDVTNVDSVGIGTFRSGINVSGGQLDVGSNIKIGNAGVITATSFSGDGSNLTGLASDKIFEGNSKVEVVDTGTGSITFVLDGTEKLNMGSYAQFNQLVYVNDTVQVGGMLQISDVISHMSNTGTRIRFPENDVIQFNTNNAQRLRIDSSGRLLTGGATSSQGSTNADDLQIGANNQGNQTGITLGSASGSSIRFADAGSDTAGAMAYYHTDDSMRFTAGASERLRIASDGMITLGNPTNTVLKAEVCNSVSGHYFVSQCDDNNDGFEVYNQHGSTATRYTFACYDNRSGSKGRSFGVRGDGKTIFYGDAYPSGDNVHDLGSDSYTWDKAYVRNAYPEQGTEYVITSGTYSNGSWHDTPFRRDSMGGLDLNGVYIVTAFADLYTAMGGNYQCNYTWIVGIRNQYTNQTLVNTCPLLSVTGHSTNNFGASGATVGDGIRLGTSRTPASSGGEETIVWRPAASTSAINNTSGRILRFRCQRIGRSSLG